MRDELVPPKQMDMLRNSARGSSDVIVYEMPFGTHNSSWDQDPKEYFGRVNEFFGRNES